MNKSLKLIFDSSDEKTMRHSALWLVHLTAIMIVVLLGGCMQEDVVLPKEGDIVTWKQTPQLIIKAKLGQRREHIPDTCAPCEADFYRPEHEHYVGQFPIDYVPEKFAAISEEEAKKLPMPYSDNQLQFSLMLNGAKGKATDASPWGGQGIDDPNQVKVFVSTYHLNMSNARLRGETELYNTRQVFEIDLMKELDASTKVSKNGLDCYGFNDGRKGKRCFGTSKNKLVSGFHFYVSPDPKSNIYGQSHELITAWFFAGKILNSTPIKQEFYEVMEILMSGVGLSLLGEVTSELNKYQIESCK